MSNIIDKKELEQRRNFKNLMKDVPKISVNDPNFFGKLRELIGVKEGETVEVRTPQFKRDPKEGSPIYYPKSKEAFDTLKILPFSTLEKFCIRKFGEIEFGELKGKILYLYPGEWYEFIPEGYEVINIMGHRDLFKKNKMDRDIRYGCLSYGFIKEGKNE